MSKSQSKIQGLIVILVIVAIFVGIQVLPKMWRDHVVQEAVHDAAENAAREAAGKAVADALPQVVKEMAEKVQRDIAKQETRSAPPPKEGAPPLVIERAAYKITMPGDSTVDPEDPKIDKDHLTEVNLPTGGTLILVVADKKELAGPEFDKATTSIQGKLENPTVVGTHTFDPVKTVRSTAMSGDLKGQRYVFETAQCEGRIRACLMILEYREEKKPETVELIRTALATFQMKD